MFVCVHVWFYVCVPATPPCLPVSQSKPVSMLLYEGQHEEWTTTSRREVLSVSAGWAGSWWEQNGGRLAGRSHALFRHHSYVARPLGQNTTRFLAHIYACDHGAHLPKPWFVVCNSSCLCRSGINIVAVALIRCGLKLKKQNNQQF